MRILNNLIQANGALCLVMAVGAVCSGDYLIAAGFGLVALGSAGLEIGAPY